MAVKNGDRVDVLKLGFKRLARLPVLYLGEKEEMGSTQMAERFSENSPRQKMTVAETERSVDEDDVQIPAEGKVLKAVVQDDGSNAEFCQSQLTVAKTILTDQDRDLPQELSHQIRLVS